MDFDFLMQPQHTPRTKPSYRALEHGGRVNFSKLLETFRYMPKDTDRPNTLIDLIRRGIWLELDGILNQNETFDLIYQAACDNGYHYAHPGQVLATYESASTWAQGVHVKWSEVNRSTPPLYKPDSSLVHPSCTPSRVYRLLDDVYESNLTPMIKKQIYVASTIQLEHLDWVFLVMSTRATSAATGGNKRYVGSNWRKAEKAGFVAYAPGLDYETAKELGLDSRSSEIRLNLDIYPDQPVKSPKVDLSLYRDHVSSFKGYIKYRRRENKNEQQAYLKSHDVSTAVQNPVPTPTPTPAPERPSAATTTGQRMSFEEYIALHIND